MSTTGRHNKRGRPVVSKSETSPDEIRSDTWTAIARTRGQCHTDAPTRAARTQALHEHLLA